MKLSRADREVFGVGTFVFALLASVLALAALVVAVQAENDTKDAKAQVEKLSQTGIIGSNVKVTLEEFTITPHSTVVKTGPVTFDVDNVGSITHEMVVVRAPSTDALPRVAKAGGERLVGDVDEEAISEANTIGETGDVPARTHVTKVFTLTPGTYVLFCNIDNKIGGGQSINHFQKGMSATITVVA